MPDNRITLRQRRFAEAYLDPNTKSGVDAARKAGYSPSWERSVTAENLAKPVIQREIERIKADRSVRARGNLIAAQGLISRGIARVADNASAQELVDLGARAALASAAILEKCPDESEPDDSHEDHAGILARRLVRSYLNGLLTAKRLSPPALDAHIERVIRALTTI